MGIIAEDFRALASSSPWLWRSIETVWDGGARLWMERPDRVVTEGPQGLTREREDPNAGRATMTFFSDAGGPFKAPPPPARRFVSEKAPSRRPDGLVAGRAMDHGETLPNQPMVRGYFSVAAFDPVELAIGVDLMQVREETWRGRTTWVARCIPGEDYEPRCGCCELLPNERTFALENNTDQFDGVKFPTSVEVWLDRQTGVMVRWLPAGGNLDPVENDIVAVDGDFDAVWARAVPAR